MMQASETVTRTNENGRASGAGHALEGTPSEGNSFRSSTKKVDILHLSIWPTFSPGSYNRLLRVQLEKLTEFEHAAISYWDGNPPANELPPPCVRLVGSKDLSPVVKAQLRLPESIRGPLNQGIADRMTIAYNWHVRKLLPQIRPRLIVCNDMYKLGMSLRSVIDWPCRVVLVQHGFSYYLPPREASRLYSLKSFDVVQVMTRASYLYDKNRLPLYEPEVEVMPYGFDVDRFRPPTIEEKRQIRERFGLPRDALIVVMLSRRIPKKGPHLVLHSWPKVVEQVPNAFLWIVGGGDPSYEVYLRNMVQTQGMAGSVRIHGPAAPAEVPACFQAADMYAFPTVHCEAMAMSMFEAMATGLPCVASSYDATFELCSGDDCLFVTSPNVADSFVEPIVRMLRDPALRAGMGQHASVMVRERYNQAVWLERLRRFYQRQLELVGNAE